MRWFVNLFRPMPLLSLLALLLTVGAVWLTRALPAPEPEPVLSVASEPPTTASAPVPQGPAPATQPEPAGPPVQTDPPGVDESASAETETPPEQAPSGDWLDPYYGLTDPDDIEAVRALLALVDSLDFSRFWRDILPLAERDNAFAQYLILAMRDYLVLDDGLLRYGYVEEPYLNRNRRHLDSPNWLHWLFANWRPDWEPDEEQLNRAFTRALSGDEAAQTLLISRTGWFQTHPELGGNLNELMGRLAGNRYLQTLNLLRLNAATLREAGPDDAAIAGLQQRLDSSSHALSQWLSGQFEEDSASASERRARLLDLAQQGYLTAIHEVRRLALDGQGRWTNAEETPVSLNDAIQLHLQLAAQHPTNPLISVALCELYLAQGDYQASWQYLRKFAYEDAWSEEVEDYSCRAGGHEAYGELMIERGVLTEDQWQQHIDTIDERRQRIRD